MMHVCSVSCHAPQASMQVRAGAPHPLRWWRAASRGSWRQQVANRHSLSRMSLKPPPPTALSTAVGRTRFKGGPGLPVREFTCVAPSCARSRLGRINALAPVAGRQHNWNHGRHAARDEGCQDGADPPPRQGCRAQDQQGMHSLSVCVRKLRARSGADPLPRRATGPCIPLRQGCRFWRPASQVRRAHHKCSRCHPGPLLTRTAPAGRCPW